MFMSKITQVEAVFNGIQAEYFTKWNVLPQEAIIKFKKLQSISWKICFLTIANVCLIVGRHRPHNWATKWQFRVHGRGNSGRIRSKSWTTDYFLVGGLIAISPKSPLSYRSDSTRTESWSSLHPRLKSAYEQLWFVGKIFEGGPKYGFFSNVMSRRSKMFYQAQLRGCDVRLLLIVHHGPHWHHDPAGRSLQFLDNNYVFLDTVEWRNENVFG